MNKVKLNIKVKRFLSNEEVSYIFSMYHAYSLDQKIVGKDIEIVVELDEVIVESFKIGLDKIQQIVYSCYVDDICCEGGNFSIKAITMFRKNIPNNFNPTCPFCGKKLKRFNINVLAFHGWKEADYSEVLEGRGVMKYYMS